MGSAKKSSSKESVRADLVKAAVQGMPNAAMGTLLGRAATNEDRRLARSHRSGK